MTNKERWLSATALLVSILPLILLAGSMQLLPDRIALPQILTDEQHPAVYISKYQYLYLGFLGFIPAAFVLLARILRYKRIVERNHMYMVVASLCVGLAFLVVTAYGMIRNIIDYEIDLLKTFEFFSGSVIIVSLLMGILANFFPALRRNEVLGLKNRYTLSDNRVWVKMHRVAADVYMGTMYLFAIFSSVLNIFMDFRFGWVHLILWALTVTGLIVWGRLYSRHVYYRIIARRPHTTVELERQD
ncbi:MAG: hypothetical protein K2L51_07840 [Clostridiales bacterium]|nr:hypothetical protein [Clostridiales bacterium]